MKRVLFLVENLPSPFDRRVWQEATTLRDAGYTVSIICPTGKGYECHFQEIEGIAIYRYDLPMEAEGALGYAIEYSSALFHTFALCWRVLFTRGFDVIHACNPPDLFFVIGAFFKLFGKKFVFDHHDINPELYEAKFGRRDFFWKLMVDSIDEVISHARTIVIGNGSPEFREVPRRLEEGQQVVDLVRIADTRSVQGVYDGICW